MRKLRLLLAAATVASAFVITSASPAHANCTTITGQNPCAVVCGIGLGNKHTAPLFRWCYVT